MNKILMKIINNKQLEDVLSIDQPKPAKTQPDLSNQSSSQQQRKSTPPAPGPGPAPTRTLSSTLLGKSSSNRQRRRTISYWNGGGNKDTVTDQSENLKISATDRNVRRHSSIAAKDPERPQSSTSTSNSGWAKALRRMSGIGWSAAKAIPDDLSKDDNSNDSVHSKSSAESPKLAAPSMSRSTSTTSSSLRRSNELGTLQEEWRKKDTFLIIFLFLEFLSFLFIIWSLSLSLYLYSIFSSLLYFSLQGRILLWRSMPHFP